jgi:hypothetical protein
MSRDHPSQFDPVSGEEVDLLLKTIREYTETLRTRVDILESIKIQFFGIFSFFLFAAPVLAYTATLIRAADDIWSEMSPPAAALALIGGATLGIAMMYLYASRGLRTFKDVQRISAILSTLVRRASQLRDRHNFGFTQKVYVDIGLADAESTLQEAHRALRGSILRLLVPGLRNIRAA